MVFYIQVMTTIMSFIANVIYEIVVPVTVLTTV